MDGRLISLVPTSTSPHHTRRMIVDERIVSCIRTLRETYGNIGKEKLTTLLAAYAATIHVLPYGATKIGKIIKRYRLTTPKGTHRISRRKPAVFRRKYAPKGVTPGHCEMDGITVCFVSHTYRFVSCIDVVTRQAWCQAVPSFSASHTIAVLQQFQHCITHPVHTVQTDNGSEFLGVFHAYLETHSIRHEFTYPRCPRINGMIERFNRTMQEECIDRIMENIDDKTLFQHKLEQYCIWYNTKRPHYALKYMTPYAYAEQIIRGQ